MSETINQIDLSLYGVGANGQVDLSGLKSIRTSNTDPNEPAHLRLFNDSGSTLKIRSDNGSLQDYVPAGAWPTYPIDASIAKIYFNVIGILPSPPVQLLMPTYYEPFEEVPPTPTLGNSPVGIGGNVTTSSVQSLSNEDSPPTPVLIIDIGNTSHTQLITIYNDGSFSWSVFVGAVKHTLMQGSIANLLQLGMSGDTVNVLGALVVATTLAAGDTTLNSLTTASAMNVGSTLTLNGRGSGKITGVQFISASLNNVFSLVNHNLGVVPDDVIGTQNQSAVDATPGNIIYDKAGSSTTQIRVCWNAGATARTIIMQVWSST